MCSWIVKNGMKTHINGCLAKWRLGAQDIQEFPLLTGLALSWRLLPCWQILTHPSHEPASSKRNRHPGSVETVERGRERGGRVAAYVIRRGKNQAPVTLIKQWKRREGQGSRITMRRIAMLEILMLMENVDSMQKLLSTMALGPRTCGILVLAQI